MRSILVLCLALLAGCRSETTAVQETESRLVGMWNSKTEPLSPAGTTSGSLYFGADGVFVLQAVTFGTLPGQAPYQVSSRSFTFGRYQASGERIAFAPDSLVTTDASGANRTVQKPYPYAGFLDDATFEIVGFELRLSYTTYPADAPVRTRRSFFRFPPD